MTPLVLIAAMLAPEPVPAEAEQALVTCLAHAARIAPYRDRTLAELASEEPFLTAAHDLWCSDEAMPYWSVAHDEARAELGLSKSDPPSSKQRPLVIGGMQRMMAAAARKAAAMPGDPPPLSDERRERFVYAWSLDNMREDGPVGEVAVPAIRCAAEKLRADPDGPGRIADLARGNRKLPPPIDAACGYDRAIGAVAALASESVPGGSPDAYRAVAADMLGTSLFYAAIAQGK